MTATTSASEGPVGDAFDGNPETYWHSGWEQGTEKLPQSVTIDLNNEYDVEQVNYLPRQGSRNGDIVKYQIEASEDGENFKPVVVGTIENDGTSIVERTKPHKIKFDKTKARYVRITALESLENQNSLYASAAEFSIFGALHSDAIPATSIELDKTELKLDTGNTETVTATILREDTTDSITWESSDPAIASVEAITSRRAIRDVSGTTNTSTVTITALKAGTATITAKANDTVSTTLTVTVENPKQEQLSALIEKVKAVKYENAALQDYVTSEIEKAEQALDKDQDTLQNAYYALAGALSESEAIQKDIDQINSFNSMDDSRYAQNDQFTLFKEQLELAKNLLSNPVQNKELIKSHVEALKKGFAQLEELNREKLANAIQEAEKVNLENCVEDDALTAFKTALDNAKAANPQTNEEIDTLVNALLDAQAGLHFKEEEDLASVQQRDSISHALDVLKNLDLKLYSDEDQKLIQDAISEGEKALANNKLSNEEASAVIETLAKALAVEPKEEEHTNENLATSQQKDSIRSALDILKDIDLDLYASKDQELIKDAIAAGEKALENDKLTNQEADDVIATLAKALSVTPKEDEKPDTENPGTNPSENPGNDPDKENSQTNSSNTVTVNPTDSSKSNGNTKTGVHSFVGLFVALATTAAATAGTVTVLKNKKIRIRRKGKK